MEINVLGMLTDLLPVTTSYKYLVSRDGISDDVDFTDEQENEMEALQNILSMEVAIYLTRRTSGCCGSIIDNLRSLRRDFISKYEAEYKISFIDYNSEVDF